MGELLESPATTGVGGVSCSWCSLLASERCFDVFRAELLTLPLPAAGLVLRNSRDLGTGIPSVARNR